MVPKKPSGWRFTCDFRELNANTVPMSWPIPNIREMLDRIGQKRPKFFAKMDLTSGYHQMPAEEATKPLQRLSPRSGFSNGAASLWDPKGG
jgi:hypothetical protein